MKSGAQAISKFDPFNMTGLPDHILAQVTDDFYFWYNDYAMREEFKLIDSYINKRREDHTPDPLLKGWLDQGLISESQYDQVVLLRGGPSDVYSDIDFMGILLGKKEQPTIEGELVSPVMDLDENLNRRNYGILIRESLDSEGNVEYHLGEPKEKPLEGQIVDKGVLITVLGPEDGAWQAGKEELSQAIENGESVDPEVIKEILEAGSDSALMARIKQRMRPGPKPIDHSSPGFLTLLDDRGLPVSKEEQLEYEQSVLKAQEEELTPEEVADREQAIQEAAEGKLDYLLEGTQWDPKLRK